MKQKIFFIPILLIIILSGLLSCNEQKAPPPDPREVIDTWKPKWAKGFEVQTLGDSSYKIILFNLDKKGDTLDIIQWKPKELQRTVCLSTTHIAMIDKIGRLDALKGVSNANNVLNENAKKDIDAGKIKNLTTGEETDAEIVLSLQPELIFSYPFGGGMKTERYIKNGIPCIPISEYLETHPLGRAEWIVLFGYFFNRPEESKRVFEKIESTYIEMSKLASTSSFQPTVFTGSYDSGSWFAPPGNSFAAQIIKDAGAVYEFSDSSSTGNLVIPFESLIHQVYDTDYWGKIFFEKGELNYQKLFEDDTRLRKIKANQSGHIFYCNAAESDYFGDAIMEPEIILMDLIAIFHPEILSQHHAKYFKPYFFEK